jgi:hypothetical protein
MVPVYRDTFRFSFNTKAVPGASTISYITIHIIAVTRQSTIGYQNGTYQKSLAGDPQDGMLAKCEEHALIQTEAAV